ncbi:Hcp family type VI secretion system effector [Acetobacter sp.]|jgi:type VI secretion system secreted protein Hcp|uniref:Hcp family type VI secretion system effector n=1 Tax=Acetobacter sp. TaxID=440 RepID=UPI0025B81F5E|nr:type VI secretion system tube protein Hcp [Acetobacter sp.]MCH4092634.1 type VI secretion system tube protein Hcp [Acetobacter sp.]MCI1299768.1 type VI secretion system tube protein Hcp [Acetobacter sp.]MCI1315352.1 type VI secretion system tube protein Hcp [Acetobacter sp.]
MAIYLQMDGVTGAVTEASHKGWVELTGFQWGVGRGLSSRVGSAADRESTAPSVGEVIVTKNNDASTGDLMSEALSGHGEKTVKIDFVRTNKDQQIVYLSLELDHVIISSYSHSSSGERPVETLALNFNKVQVTTSQMDSDGSAGGNKITTYDLSTATAS